VPAGKTVTYAITAENTGNIDLPNVQVADDLSGVLPYANLVAGSVQAWIDGSPVTAPTITGNTLTWLGTVPAGKTLTVLYQVVVKQDVTAQNQIVNKVKGSAPNPLDPNEEVPSTCEDGTEDPCSSILTPGVPGFTVTKVSDPVTGSLVRPGNVITYTITGVNTGNVPLTAVTLTDDLAKVLAYAALVGGSLVATIDGQPAAAPTLTGTTLSWVGALAPSQRVVVTYQVVMGSDVTAFDLVKNGVKGKATYPDNPDSPVDSNCKTGEEPGCSSTITPGVAQLTVTKVSDPVSGSKVKAGGQINYTVTARNSGNLALNPVVVSDDLTDILAQATLDQTSLKASIDGRPVAGLIVVGQELTWLGPLAPGEVLVITYTVVVNKDATPKTELTNNVTASGTDPKDPDDPAETPCETGDEPGCSSTVVVDDPPKIITGGSVVPVQQVPQSQSSIPLVGLWGQPTGLRRDRKSTHCHN
jgi:uncharacterized repeat protein (TIGR01451 family)/fimbrial isopeptide formation D2 family protein